MCYKLLSDSVQKQSWDLTEIDKFYRTKHRLMLGEPCDSKNKRWNAKWKLLSWIAIMQDEINRWHDVAFGDGENGWPDFFSNYTGTTYKF